MGKKIKIIAQLVNGEYWQRILTFDPSHIIEMDYLGYNEIDGHIYYITLKNNLKYIIKVE